MKKDYTKIIDKCQSCNANVLNKIREIDIDRLGLKTSLLCEVCNPWVKPSLEKAYTSISGINIDDPLLFSRMIRKLRDFEEPKNDLEWFALFQKLHPRKASILDAIDMSLDIRKNDVINYNLTNLSLNEFVDFSNEMFQDRDFRYRQMMGLQLPQREPRNTRIGLHELNYEHTTRIAKIDGKDFFEPGYGFLNNLNWSILHELIFDSIHCLSPDPLHVRMDNFSIILPIIEQLDLGFPPKTPFILEYIFQLKSGRHGKILQYKLLALLQLWNNRDVFVNSFITRDEEPWARSFRLLRSVVEGVPNARFIPDGIEVIGSSRAIYTIKPAVFSTRVQKWLVQKNMAELICIEIKEEFSKLPLGDQLATLVHSLSDDLGTMHLIETLENSIRETFH